MISIVRTNPNSPDIPNSVIVVKCVNRQRVKRHFCRSLVTKDILDEIGGKLRLHRRPHMRPVPIVPFRVFFEIGFFFGGLNPIRFVKASIIATISR